MKKIIVIGGSTGAIPVLCDILKGLPSNLDAAIFAVIHTSQQSTYLPEVLGRSGALPVLTPDPAESIKAGKVYLAKPNRHLVIKSGLAISTMGPRENRHRPAIDTLFRSAARFFRRNVISVVLSGAQDDGSDGALAVKARGGTVMVQDPTEAIAHDMPANVIRVMKPDFCLRAEEIPGKLIRLVARGKTFRISRVSSTQKLALAKTNLFEVEPYGYTCPECDGVVTLIKKGNDVQFRCHVGHSFSLASFTEAHSDALERALWVALRKLNEHRKIQETLAGSASHPSGMKKRYRENAEAAKHDIDLLHEILTSL